MKREDIIQHEKNIDWKPFLKLRIYEILITFLFVLVSWLAFFRYQGRCFSLVGDVLMNVNCGKIETAILNIFTIIPNISEKWSLSLILHPPIWLDWILSFFIYYFIILVLLLVWKKIKKRI